MKEKNIVLKIKSWLNGLPKSFFFKMHGSLFSAIGISDLIGVYNGIFIAIEVKRPETVKNVTAIQQWFIDKVNECGGIAFVATSLEDAKIHMEGVSAPPPPIIPRDPALEAYKEKYLTGD